MASKIYGYLDDMFSALTEDGVFIDYDDCVMIRNTIHERIAELENRCIAFAKTHDADQKRIAELEATHVPDELLADLIWGCKSHYQELGDVEEAEAILAKRKEAHND